MNQLIELIIFNNLFCVEAEYLFPSIIFWSYFVGFRSLIYYLSLLS